MGLKKIIHDAPCKIARKFMGGKRQHRVVRASLARHAENYQHLESDKARQVEDRAASNFVETIYHGNPEEITRHMRFYGLLKKRYLKDSS
jgi:hypothetical protein